MNIEEQMARDERAMERLATAMERMADLLAKIVDEMYPPKHEPRDVTLTNIPSDIDLIKANQGATEETTEDWLTDVGPREREFIETSATSKGGREIRADKKASRFGTVKGKS